MRRVPPSGPKPAKVMIVGEAPGADEERGVYPHWRPGPFIGRSGDELDRMLAEVGISRNECFLTNVVGFKPKDTGHKSNDLKTFFYPTAEAKAKKLQPYKGLYPQPFVIDELARLYKEIEEVKPDTIIAFGNYALWALSEGVVNIADEKGYKVPTGIASWRGSMLALDGCKLLPTYHPAAILRQWAWRNIVLHDLRRVVQYLGKDWPDPGWNFIIRPSFKETMDALQGMIKNAEACHSLGEKYRLSVDIETRGGYIACVGLAWSQHSAICIPFMCAENLSGYWSYEEEVEIALQLRKLLSHRAVYIIGQNFLYDAQYFAQELGVALDADFDTMITQHLCFPALPKGLDFLSSMYCAHHVFWKEDGKEWGRRVDEDELWAYNCTDVVKTFEVSEVLEGVVRGMKLEEQFLFQHRVAKTVLRVTLRGVRVDRKRKEAFIMELMEAAADRARWFEEMVGENVLPRKKKASPWYNSPKQTAELFYDILGIKAVKGKGKGGASKSTADAALETLKKREPLIARICEMLQEYRSLNTINKTLKAKLDPDGRMRCSYNVAGTKTFRFSSSENAFGRGTNLQNITRGLEEEEIG